MVFKYKRRTDRQAWSEESMQNAITAVLNGEMGYYRASASFGVPQTTLERYVKKARGDPGHVLTKSLGRFKPIFSPEQEKELADYLMLMEKRLFGLTMTECRRLAFQLAELNGCDHPFNKELGMAGKGWMQGFFRRHQALSIRTRSNIWSSCNGIQQDCSRIFFQLLTETVDKYKLTADRIFNVDETGVSVIPKGMSKIIATKGKRQVRALSSGERGETVTVEICFSAPGAYMPPMFIFGRKKMQQAFMDGIVPGMMGRAKREWMDGQRFIFSLV